MIVRGQKIGLTGRLDCRMWSKIGLPKDQVFICGQQTTDNRLENCTDGTDCMLNTQNASRNAHILSNICPVTTLRCHQFLHPKQRLNFKYVLYPAQIFPATPAAVGSVAGRWEIFMKCPFDVQPPTSSTAPTTPSPSLQYTVYIQQLSERRGVLQLAPSVKIRNICCVLADHT
jgi:hypothetical protein